MSQELNQDCAICLSLGDICVSCEEQTAALAPAGVKPVVHRYRVVKMLSEDGNKIDYKPHGPWVVMADIHHDHVTRLQAENAALQQRLNVADQRVDELNTALETCGRWFAKHSPTAPLIGGFGEAEHPMITFIRGAQSVPAAKVDCGNCAFVDGVCSTGCETQRIRAAQQ
ncbi:MULTISPECIES: hypothetical protein [unclassified Pseudomonas]|uniref:hypothetical protein n=1 Tax=unclassified Pseudomonas TaxID=196821 RepID=UPI0025D79F5D|nr:MULTISPECIES: hypothetical protein [unclassified Pseudomonas]